MKIFQSWKWPVPYFHGLSNFGLEGSNRDIEDPAILQENKIIQATSVTTYLP